MTLRTFNKMWRPMTAIMLAVNLFAFPWVLFYMNLNGTLKADTHGLWFNIFGAMAALYAGIAGIRQFDKHKEHEITKDINIMSMGYSPHKHDDYEYEEPRSPMRRKKPIRRTTTRRRREDVTPQLHESEDFERD